MTAEQVFEEWWVDNYAGYGWTNSMRNFSHQEVALKAYLAATERAAGIVKAACICKEYDAACLPCKLEAEIRG